MVLLVSEMLKMCMRFQLCISEVLAEISVLSPLLALLRI